MKYEVGDLVMVTGGWSFAGCTAVVVEEPLSDDFVRIKVNSDNPEHTIPDWCTETDCIELISRKSEQFPLFV